MYFEGQPPQSFSSSSLELATDAGAAVAHSGPEQPEFWINKLTALNESLVTDGIIVPAEDIVTLAQAAQARTTDVLAYESLKTLQQEYRRQSTVQGHSIVGVSSRLIEAMVATAFPASVQAVVIPESRTPMIDELSAIPPQPLV